MKKLSILFATLALSTAFAGDAETHRIEFTQPTMINGTELTPGTYKVEIQGNQATFLKGKTRVDAPVTTQEAADKNRTTQIRYEGENVQEIRFGGSHTRLLFGGATSTAPGTR